MSEVKLQRCAASFSGSREAPTRARRANKPRLPSGPLGIPAQLPRRTHREPRPPGRSPRRGVLRPAPLAGYPRLPGASSPPARSASRGRSANVESGCTQRAAFHTSVSGRSPCPTIPQQDSDTTRARQPGSSVARPILELNSLGTNQLWARLRTNCGRKKIIVTVKRCCGCHLLADTRCHKSPGTRCSRG